MCENVKKTESGDKTMFYMTNCKGNKQINKQTNKMILCFTCVFAFWGLQNRGLEQFTRLLANLVRTLQAKSVKENVFSKKKASKDVLPTKELCLIRFVSRKSL